MQAERFEIANKNGKIRCEFYHAGSDRAVIYMHGVGGGTHGPANIYHPLAEELAKDNISSLLIECRYNCVRNECISDILACIDYLEKQYHQKCIGLIGWSFGGVVVIAVAAMDKRVKTVVTVASQSSGSGDVDKMHASIMLLHGTGEGRFHIAVPSILHPGLVSRKSSCYSPGRTTGSASTRTRCSN